MGIQRQLMGREFAGQREASGIQRRQIEAGFEQYAQQFASGIDAQELARQQWNKQTALSQSLQQSAQDRQFLLSAAQVYGQMNPALGMLGTDTTINNIPQMASMMGQQQQPSVGPIYGQGLGYGTDLFSGNQNMQMDLWTSWQNNMAQIEAAKIASAGMLGGAQAGAGGAIAGSAIGGIASIAGAGIAAF
jgi:hypothetical protein